MKASSMIKFGYIMLAANMFLAGLFWFLHGEDWRWQVRLFMIGSMIWIVGILIWYKVAEGEKEHEHK